MAQREELPHKLRLHERFATRQGYSTTLYETAVSYYLVKQLTRRKLILALPLWIPCIWIVTEKTAQRTALHERHEAYARAIDCAECLYRMYPSDHLTQLHLHIDGAREHVKLLLTGELDEIHGISADTYRELRILLRVIHSVEQQAAVEHIVIDRLSAMRSELSVKQGHKVLRLHVAALAEGRGRDSKRVRYTVT